MVHPSIRVAACAALVVVAPAQAQVDNSSENTSSEALNLPQGGSEGVNRVLTAPRLDPSTPSAEHVAVHWRFFNSDQGDAYRERIEVLTNGAFSLLIEEGATSGVTPVDESGNPLNTDGDAENDVWGGAAYATSRLLLDTRQTSGSDYFSGFRGDRVEFNTFGGLTINGARTTGVPRIAFFAGLVNPSSITPTTQTGEPTLLNPSNPLDPFDPDLAGSKARPLRRGIWSSVGVSGDIRLRALERDSDRPAPVDPAHGLSDPFIGREFQRLHPSDYEDVSTEPQFNPNGVLAGSLLAEQRFSRVNNLTMNNVGALAFRADIAIGLTPRHGIWADDFDLGGAPTLHRVFLEDVDSPVSQIAFDNTASNAPAPFYRIRALGPPAISNNGTLPHVAAYAMLQSDDGVGGLGDPVGAIIARRPGVDGATGLGHTPKILVIEDEPFNLTGGIATFTFVNSFLRNELSSVNSGPPGLADVAERQITPGVGQIRESYKDTNFFSPSAVIYKPRPAINRWNELAFLGRINTKNGVQITATDPITGDLLDEGVYTTQGTPGGAEFRRIAFEGDPAPVVRNGSLLAHARFACVENAPFSPGFNPADDAQVFYRPVINGQGQILFIGSWLSDPPGGPVEYGRSLFLSHLDGTLECVATSGDTLGQQILVPQYDMMGEVLPGGPAVDVELTADFGRVPNALGLGNQDAVAYEQAMLNDCGVVVFTTRLIEVDGHANRGWGLFVVNTADPRSSPLGPQLLVKSGSGQDDGDDRFQIDNELLELTGAFNAFFPEAISYGYGDSEEGDTPIHPDGSTIFAVNPDAPPDRGLLVLGKLGLDAQDISALDFDGDGILDGCDCFPEDAVPQGDIDADGIPDDCDNCPSVFNPDQSDIDSDGTGDVCEPGGGGGGGCTNCLECIEIDCEFNGMLLGAGPDFDQSGVVDDTDLNLMMMAWGYTEGRFDMNKDGIVGEKDLALLMEDYGKTVETK